MRRRSFQGFRVDGEESIKSLSEEEKKELEEKGYQTVLPERDLVNTAVALYFLTDEEGKTDLKKVQDFDYPERQYIIQAE